MKTKWFILKDVINTEELFDGQIKIILIDLLRVPV